MVVVYELTIDGRHIYFENYEDVMDEVFLWNEEWVLGIETTVSITKRVISRLEFEAFPEFEG